MKPPLLVFLLWVVWFGLTATLWQADARGQTVWTNTDAELIVNGDMETDAGWVFPVTPVQGGYSYDRYVSPVRSARLGIVSGTNQYAYSSMHQTIHVPPLPAGGSLTLTWAAYLLSQPQDGSDLQYVQIRDEAGRLHTIWSGQRNDAPHWLICSYDVSAYADQSIVLYFGVKNDGSGGITAMYVDDVSLMLSASPSSAGNRCQPMASTPTPEPVTPTPTPTATPMPTHTPTPTPTPSGPPCQQLIQNPDFNQDYTGWTQNLYLTARYRDETGQEHEGAWFGGAEFVDHYLYQDVTIPAGSPAARLSFLWAFDPDENIGPGESLTITLRATDDTPLAHLLTIDQSSTPRRWLATSMDLTPYIGQTIRFHAQATTHASTTAWYLDQILLYNCELTHTIHLPWVVEE